MFAQNRRKSRKSAFGAEIIKSYEESKDGVNKEEAINGECYRQDPWIWIGSKRFQSDLD